MGDSIKAKCDDPPKIKTKEERKPVANTQQDKID